MADYLFIADQLLLSDQILSVCFPFYFSSVSKLRGIGQRYFTQLLCCNIISKEEIIAQILNNPVYINWNYRKYVMYSDISNIATWKCYSVSFFFYLTVYAHCLIFILPIPSKFDINDNLILYQVIKWKSSRKQHL